MKALEGFAARSGPATRLWIAEDWADEIEPLALEAPGSLARWCETGEPVPGGRARGWRLGLASGRRVHLREVAHGGWLRAWTGRRFADLRRATRPLAAARALHARGVAVPAPVLALAERRGPFWHLTLANAFVDDATPVDRFLPGAVPNDAEPVAAAAGAAVRRLHAAGGIHRDLHLGNLLLTFPGPAVWIVDLDGLRAGPPPTAASRCRRERSRMERSLAKLSLGEEARTSWTRGFETGYLAGEGPASGVAESPTTSRIDP